MIVQLIAALDNIWSQQLFLGYDETNLRQIVKTERVTRITVFYGQARIVWARDISECYPISGTCTKSIFDFTWACLFPRIHHFPNFLVFVCH
jgi:hypothetical protein